MKSSEECSPKKLPTDKNLLRHKIKPKALNNENENKNSPMFVEYKADSI